MKNKTRTRTRNCAYPLKFMVIILTIITAIVIYRENRKIIICLDAGHGGKDARLCSKR